MADRITHGTQVFGLPRVEPNQQWRGLDPRGQTVPFNPQADTVMGQFTPQLYQRMFVPQSMVEVDNQPNWWIHQLNDNGNVTVSNGLQTREVPAKSLLMRNAHLLPPHTVVNVRRSNGAVEAGWAVTHTERQYVTVMKGGVPKTMTMFELLEQNPEMLPPASRPAPPPPPAPPRPLILPGAVTPNPGATVMLPGARPNPNATIIQAGQFPGTGRPAVQPAPVPVPPPPPFPGRMFTPSPSSAVVSSIQPQWTQNLMSGVRFTARLLPPIMGSGETMSLQFLQSRGLQPIHMIQLGNQRVFVSQPFNHKNQRTAFVGYIENGDGTVSVRTFYQSNSQGIWRSASHYGIGGWIGKGKESEESTNLPIPMQKALSQLSSGTPRQMSPQDADTAFYGNLQFGGHSPPQEFTNQVAVGEFGTFDKKTTDGYGDPTSFRFVNPQSQGPDLDHLEDSYRMQHPKHGAVDAYQYRSHDGSHRFLFFRDQAGRAWLGAVEDATSPINGFGVRSHALNPGDLTMPGIEYASQVPRGYAGEHVTDQYVDATPYTHSLGIVKRFLAHMGGAPP